MRKVDICLLIFLFFCAVVCGELRTVRKELDVGGIYTNWWIDAARDIGVKDGKIRIGQTFRCAGDVIEEVGFGIWRFKSGMAVNKQVSNVVFLLKKGGINGEIVKKIIFSKGKVPQKEKARLRVHLRSWPEIIWYFEVQILNPKLPEGAISFNARRVDCYPDGEMYFNGEKVEGELGLKVVYSKKVEVHKDNKIVFWSARSEDFVRMRTSETIDLMSKDDMSKPVRIVCARNEYEARQFVITPGDGVKIDKVELRVTDLVSEKGDVIGKDNVTVEWMRYVLEWQNVKGHSRFSPDPLEPTNVAYYDDEDCNGKVSEKTNTIFWVTFYVPKGTKVGKYKGQVVARVRLSGGEEMICRRELEVEVLDMTLPVWTHTRTALFRGYVNEWVLRDLARYRISSGGMPNDVKRFVKFGRLMNKLGVAVSFVGPWGRDLYDAFGAVSGSGAEARAVERKKQSKALSRCKRYYDVFYPILKREGWVEQAYSRLPDEFRSEEMARRACAYVKKVRRWAPGLKILVTGIGNNREVLERAVGCCDIWCPSIRYCESNLEFYRQRVLSGDRVWPYIHEFSWFYYPAGYLRYYFWALKKNGFGGVCYWTVGPRGRFSRTKFGFVRDDNVCPGDGTLYYPVIGIGESIGRRGGMAGTKGIEPMFWHSARLSRIRDGIEDMEYLWVMKEAIGKKQAEGGISLKVHRQIDEIRSFIGDFAYSLDYFKADSYFLDKVRKKIAKIIEELRL